jgi:hypothetical protein
VARARVARVATLGLVAALVALLTSAVAAVAAPDKARVERPVYQVGDKWVRTDGAYELVRIDKDVYVFATGTGKEFHLTRDLAITRIVLDGRAEFDVDSPPKLSWPLEVGKWGVGRAFWRAAPPRALVSFTGSINMTWQVDRAEDVVTGAGTFRTLRINQKIESIAARGSGQQFGQTFLWYAPDVQRFVKAESNLKGLSWALAVEAAPPAPPVVASPAPRSQPRPPADAHPPAASPPRAPAASTAPAPVAPTTPAATAPAPVAAAPAPTAPPSAPATPPPRGPSTAQPAPTPAAPAATPAPAPATPPPPPAPPPRAPSTAMPAQAAPAPATPPAGTVASTPPANAPQPVAPLRRSDVEAPKITINSPLQDARLAEEQILITGLVTDNIDVVRVEVLVNGVEATPLREVGVTGKGVQLGAIASLKLGPNVIEVIATNKAGNVARVLRTVTRVAEAPPTSAAPPR